MPRKRVEGSDLCRVCGIRPKSSYPSQPSFSYCVECNRDEMRKAAQLRKDWLDSLKLEAGCSLCGYNTHPAALTWDHINPLEKSFDIARGKRVSLSKLQQEIAKCRILCANCHNIHSFNEEHYKCRSTTRATTSAE